MASRSSSNYCHRAWPSAVLAVVAGLSFAQVGFSATTPAALQFVPVTPCRVADTRNAAGPFGGPELSAGTSRAFDIPQSACGIPTTAVAYSLNVTVVPNASLNYLTIWPTGEPQPYVSTLNSDGRVKANAAIVPAGTNGGVSVFVTDTTQVILDIDGYFAPAGTTSALAFYPVTPCRIADTRNADGPLGGPFISAGSSRAFPIPSSNCDIPSTAQAYSLNVTAVPHKTLNYLTAWPTGKAQPYVSTLNSSTGAVTANAAIVPAGSNGEISIYVHDDADVILDTNGYFAPLETGGLSLYTVTPCRVIDTRSGKGLFDGLLTVDVETSVCAPPATAQAYVLNGTVVPAGSLNYLTLWPAGAPQPYVSTLNADDGAVTSNMAIVPSTNGSIDAYAYNPTNLILDISGYFASAQAPDFSISAMPSSVSTKMGTTSSPLTVSVTGLNGFSGSVSVAIGGVPKGTTCTPSCLLTIEAGSSAQVSFVVPANAVTGQFALSVQGTSGNLSHKAPLTLDVTSSLQAFWNLTLASSLVSQNGAQVTGDLFVSGWALETIPLTAVSILVDNKVVGNAFYGTPRPDIVQAIPGSPEDCGFSLGIDTTTLANGLHTIAVNVTDSASNVTSMLNYPNNSLTLQVNVNNTAPPATGPVANLTLNAPTTSLTAGTIVGFTASATDSSSQPVSPSFSWNSTNPSVVEVTPTGAVLPLQAGNATISVSAGGKTQQAAVTVQAGSGTPGTIQVSLGPEEVVFQYTRDACMEGDFADNPAHAIRLSDGSLLLDAGSNPFYFADTGADFYSLKRRCTPMLVSTDSPTASTFMNRQWIFSLYRDGSTIHALIHNEFHDPVAPDCKPGDSTDGNPCQYTSITYAASTDGGHSFTMSATPQNLVAPPPAQWTPPAPGSPPLYYGYQEPLNIVHAADGYYYTRFGEFPPPGYPYFNGECVMRTQTLSDPSSWRAWNGTSFSLQMTDPYTGTPATLCTPSNVTVPYESLTYNTYLSMFMLVGLDTDFGNPPKCGFYFSLSSDLVNWTQQQFIAPAYVAAGSQCEKPGAGGLAGVFAYASVIDHDDPSINFETPGRTPYIYYTRFNDNIDNRDVIRVPVIITKY